jgi:hypothetical protein
MEDGMDAKETHTQIAWAHSRAKIQREIVEAQAKYDAKLNQIVADMLQHDEDDELCDEEVLAKRIDAIPEIHELGCSKVFWEELLEQMGELVEDGMIEFGAFDETKGTYLWRLKPN